MVLVALTVWWTLRLGEGAREFRESQQALQLVTSWQQEARVGAEDGKPAEIVCTDRGNKRSPTDISALAPIRQSDKGLQDISTVTAQCANLGRGEYLYPLPDYNHLIAHTKIFKGAIDTVHGVECQEWTTVHVIPGRFSPTYPLDDSQICIGLNDHLPRRIKYTNAEYIFDNWNTASPIEGLEKSQPKPSLRP